MFISFFLFYTRITSTSNHTNINLLNKDDYHDFYFDKSETESKIYSLKSLERKKRSVEVSINGTNDEIGSGNDYNYEYYYDNETIFDDYTVNPAINYSSKNDENGIISSTQNIFRNTTQNITLTSSDATSPTKMPNITTIVDDNIIFTTVETNNIDGNLDLVKLLCLIGLFAAIVSVIFIFSYFILKKRKLIREKKERISEQNLSTLELFNK
ncbi:hypothetical protein H312_02781 [Anncaliia algerae PRA339]|uniref:Uncharacterized protein n=1 Tax=Anncaliia algerae PRA339 TaxID=1288291 RepID=A0A059EXP6_9MICR|nr:hypothetical protein H312_02781 [Anncaliia algerae PRA339]